MTSDANIHNNWSYIQLKESISYVKGKKPENLSEEFIKGYLPYLSTEYLRKGIVTKYAELTGKVISVVDNEILLLWDGSNAGEFLKGKNGILSSTMVKIKHGNKDFVTLYLYYQLKKKESYLRGLTQGTGIPHVDRNVLMDIRIPRPPLPEQHKIASILSKVDEHISHTEAIIEKTEELKKGMMQQLLTKGIGHTKFKKTEVGEIPEEWDVKKIDEIKANKKNSIAMGPFGSNITVDNFVPTGIPVIRGLNLTHVYLVECDFVYISEKKANELSASNAFPNDIVITHRGTVGQVSIIPCNSRFSRYVVSQSQMKLTCEKEIVSPYFVNFFLNSVIGQSLLLRNKSGTGVPAIGQPTTSLKRIPIPIPPLDEQNNIVKIIASVYDQLSQNQTYLSHLQELKTGLMQDLLTGKVRVTV